MTNDQKEKAVKALYTDGWVRWDQGQQEFEIIDFSTTWDGEFTFSRFGVSEMIVVQLSAGDILDAAKWLGVIEAYIEQDEDPPEVIVDWDKPFQNFYDWYNDNIDERIISHAIFLEISYKIDKINRLKKEIGTVAKLNINEMAA